MSDSHKNERFRTQVLPHLDAAWNLARWLTRSEHDADDVVQDACMRAYQFLDGLRGDRARPWLLAIVRNAAYAWLETRRRNAGSAEEVAELEAADTPETLALLRDERQRVNAALRRLPVEFREVLVLREIEELSYREIAQVTGVPIGTVMSRLARSRQMLIGQFNADAETARGNARDARGSPT